MVVKRSKWKSVLTVTSVCTALLGSVNTAVKANPMLVAQSATVRTPQTITGQLDQNSAVLEGDGTYFETHTFDGNAGEALTIELTSDEFDAVLILLSPTGESIAQDDDGAGGTNARIVITLPITGTYTIVANSYQARKLGEYQLAWRGATTADQELALANELNQQAWELYRAGRYAEVDPLLQRALAIRESQLGPDHPDTATSLNNLALLYHSMGRYAEAESLFQRSLAIIEMHLGPDHPDTATSLNNLALLYRSIDRYTEAESLFQRSLAISQAHLGPDHPDTASSLDNLAGLYESMGRYAEAEPLFQRSLAIREAHLGPDHPSTATSLNNFAGLYRAMGRYAEAELLYQRSLAIAQTHLGPEHPDTATSLNNLAVLYWAQGQLQPTFNYLQRGLTVQEAVLIRNLVVGSDANKRDYLATVSVTTDAAISLYLNDLPTNTGAAQLALTTILQRKGRILDLFTNLRDQLADDTEAVKLLDELTAASTQLSNLTDNPVPDLSPEDYTAQLNRLQAQVDTLEGQLSRRSEEFAELTTSPSLADIRTSLPRGTVLVEFIRYRPLNPSAPPDERFGPPHYAAFLLFPNGTLQGMDLGHAEAIDAAVGNLADSLASSDTPKFQIKEEAQTLETLVMTPVRQALGDTTTVFLSPDGALNLIPFEALVDENNNYLVERYQFRYLTSGRDLMRIANTTTSDNPVVLMGDPTFGSTEEPPVSRAKDSTRREINLEENVFPPLAGTRLEVEGIAQHFPEAQVYLTTTATEAQLKTAQQPSILHLATHGFFRTTEETLNPLLQSGLVLAGVTERQSGPEENGVLTALEVTSLALRGTQLVVLSACETGLGELSVSEGIYGLRRALVLAGSQSQVMSLWKVDDTATQELMVAYYEKLRAGFPRDQALTDTQREFLLNPDYDHPYYWAAFIGSGDWRPLR